MVEADRHMSPPGSLEAPWYTATASTPSVAWALEIFFLIFLFSGAFGRLSLADTQIVLVQGRQTVDRAAGGRTPAKSVFAQQAVHERGGGGYTFQRKQS